MATTYNFTDGSISGDETATQVNIVETDIEVLRNIIDFSQQTIQAGASDVAQAVSIPADTTVLTAVIKVITADDANTTVDLGYGGSVNVWGNALSVASADAVVGGTFSPVYFSSADTVDLVATTDGADVDIDGAKVEVCVLCLNHSS